MPRLLATLLLPAWISVAPAALAAAGDAPQGEPADAPEYREPSGSSSEDAGETPEASSEDGEATGEASTEPSPPAPTTIEERRTRPTGPATETHPGAFDNVLIQLNWGDGNLLVGAGETRENSPGPSFGRCPDTQIDGIPSEDCSRGQSRLGLYKSVDLGDGLSAAGALVVGMGVETDPTADDAGQVDLFDLGSYIRLVKRFGADEVNRFFLELYPVDARPLRLGFHPSIEWGTRDEFPQNFRRGLAPGLKAGVELGDFYLFAGVKSALIKSPTEVELENPIGNRILFSTRTFYGALAGAGYARDEGIAVEANGGFFHKGTLTKEGVLGQDIFSGGGSLRLAWRQGLPIGLRVDSSLYRRSDVGAQVIERAEYDAGISWMAEAEGTVRVQNLADFERPESTALEWAQAGHAGFKLRVRDTRLHLASRVRSLTYITAQVPGFFPYATLPDDARTEPEVQGLASVDHRFGDVTLALTGGIRRPATYRGLPPEGTGGDAATAGIRTVVVSDPQAGGWYILPTGDGVKPVMWTELGAQWHPAEQFALMGELLIGRDPNKTQVERDEKGHARRVFTEPRVVGINLMGQFVF